MTLTDFLTARLVEDERASGLAELPKDTDLRTLTREQNEAASKLMLLTLFLDASLDGTHNPQGDLPERLRFSFHEGEKFLAEQGLLTMARAYADHPDFDESWRLDA